MEEVQMIEKNKQPLLLNISWREQHYACSGQPARMTASTGRQEMATDYEAWVYL